MHVANEGRWSKLWRKAHLTGDPVPVFNELLEFYCSPDRYYHNLMHINACLEEFDMVRPLAPDPLALELAIWLHDVIYDTHAVDNEERSAEFARDCLARAKARKSLIAKVSELILVTRHCAIPSDCGGRLMVDIDLSIFGQSNERFRDYETQIRQEYAWVPDQLFAAKRAEILNAFLKRERIYGTEIFLGKYEEQARQNLRSSIDILYRSSHTSS